MSYGNYNNAYNGNAYGYNANSYSNSAGSYGYSGYGGQSPASYGSSGYTQSYGQQPSYGGGGYTQNYGQQPSYGSGGYTQSYGHQPSYGYNGQSQSYGTNPYSPYATSSQTVAPASQRLGQYATGELAYDARLASHEEQIDGSSESAGPQGSIFWQILANGSKNGQASVFLNTSQRQQWFVNAFMKSIGANGQLNGNFLRESIADSYYQGTGVDILPQLNQAPSLNASTNNATLYKQVADPSQGANYVTNLQQQSGWSQNQIIGDALWGHAQNLNTTISNPQTKSFLNDAYNNPSNFQDYPLVHLSPQTAQYTQGLINSSDPAMALNQAFLEAQGQSFGLPSLGQITHG